MEAGGFNCNHILSILFSRPFCKWLCPLGAFYALMNKVSLFGIKVDEHKCVSCGKCAGACKMDVDITKRPTTQNVYVAASASVSVRRRR